MLLDHNDLPERGGIPDIRCTPRETTPKARYSVPPFGIDLFEGSLKGLILAEAEFESASEAESLRLPPFLVREVSEYARFAGARLAHASRQEVQNWLAEYGIQLPA